MNTNPHTFSNTFHDITEQIETKKTNYWLEKLFNQQEQKSMDDKKERELTGEKFGIQSLTQSEINKSPPQILRRGMSPEEKGIEAHIESNARKKESDRVIIRGMVLKSNRALLCISSVFPFDFFPNTITVEDTRITIILRDFFFSSQVHSIDIKDISNIFIYTAPLFATLTIVSRTYIENDIKIAWLKKREAMHTRRIIEGLRMFVNEKIDTSNYEIGDLLRKLESLSTNKMIM